MGADTTRLEQDCVLLGVLHKFPMYGKPLVQESRLAKARAEFVHEGRQDEGFAVGAGNCDSQ